MKHQLIIDCLGFASGNMKLLVVVVCVVAAVVGEPQGYRDNFFQRQEQEDPTPYPPSGYRPSRQFLLPTERRELLEPSDPRTFYGVPDEESSTTTESPTTTEYPTTTDSVPTTTLSPQSSQLNDARAIPDAEDVEEVEPTDAQKTPAQADAQGQQGVYYVLLPTGQLQRVQYLTRVDDVRRMAYTAQLKYANVEPITGPIYSYNPSSSFLQIVA